jgi:hypothetical protein
MFKKIITTVSVLSMVSGFILVLGTAGSADLNLIDIGTLIARGFVGVILTGFGFVGLTVTQPVYFG